MSTTNAYFFQSYDFFNTAQTNCLANQTSVIRLLTKNKAIAIYPNLLFRDAWDSQVSFTIYIRLMLENIITYSLSSIFWGTLISLVCVGMLLALIKNWNKNAFFSPISFIMAGILFLILAYNCTGIYSTIAMKSDIDFLESMISQMVNISQPDYNSSSSQEVSSEIVRQIIDESPILNYYLDSTKFDNCTISELPHIIASRLYDSLNSMILKKSIWSVVFLIIGTVVIVKTMDNRAISKRRTTTSRYSSERVSTRTRRPTSSKR